MGTISYSVPTVGDLNATADPLLRTALSTILTLVNGNLDTNNLSPTAGIVDGQLASSDLGLRKVLLQSVGLIPHDTVVGTYVFTGAGLAVASGASISAAGLPAWVGGTEFAVSGKTQRARVRLVTVANAQSPGAQFAAGLYPVTPAGGSGLLTATLGTVLAGSSTSAFGPTGSTVEMRESAQFDLPTTATGYVLGLALAGGTTAANSATACTVTLELYHS